MLFFINFQRQTRRWNEKVIDYFLKAILRDFGVSLYQIILGKYSLNIRQFSNIVTKCDVTYLLQWTNFSRNCKM